MNGIKYQRRNKPRTSNIERRASNETENDAELAYDYARIEKAIAFLREHYLEQPDLAEVARHVHLSEFHFQRLFSRWAGISPKRFLQLLTLKHAQQLLAASRPLLEVSLDSGLSGPSRLHDLFVAIEGVTPGEFKRHGAGLEIRYGLHPTCFGNCLLAITPRGICWLSFVPEEAEDRAVAELRAHWSGAILRADSSARGASSAIIAGVRNVNERCWRGSQRGILWLPNRASLGDKLRTMKPVVIRHCAL